MKSQRWQTKSNGPYLQRRGAANVLASFMMVGLVGVGAFVIDVGYIATSRTQLQATADAAALAGATSLALDESPEITVQQAHLYADNNLKKAYTTVSVGAWDPVSRVFTPGSEPPNAVRARSELSLERGNAIPSFFARIFGRKWFDVSVEAVAVGPTPNATSSSSDSTSEVYVTSSKNLSNVVLRFADNSHQKFDGLSGYSNTFTGTGEHEGKSIIGVWIKSGCYFSGDGPGYGEYISHPGDGTTVHGDIANKGCNAHVTATFGSSGAVFSESGSQGPVRLVQ